MKGKQQSELAKLEMHGYALHDTLWQEGVVMLGSHPESKKGPAEKSHAGCKNTVLQFLFGLKVSHTNVTPKRRRKDSFLLGMASEG